MGKNSCKTLVEYTCGLAIKILNMKRKRSKTKLPLCGSFWAPHAQWVVWLLLYCFIYFYFSRYENERISNGSFIIAYVLLGDNLRFTCALNLQQSMKRAVVADLSETTRDFAMKALRGHHMTRRMTRLQRDVSVSFPLHRHFSDNLWKYEIRVVLLHESVYSAWM